MKSVKSLVVPYLDGISRQSSHEKLLSAMDDVPDHNVEEVSWPAFPYRPHVRFKLAHASDCLLLSYLVREKHVRAFYTNTNDPVYKDSCVEFFLSFDTRHYYNLEFNCAGTGLIGYGDSDLEKRRRLPKELIETVKAIPSVPVKEALTAEMRWGLLLVIPFSVFDTHAITGFGGMRCTGNFYKCGDELPIPHFLSWNRIDHPTPNFHLPQFFGDLVFQ
ncbi:carbohydrate-binding family 9-like protein [Parapedobacter sp. GCM10030251]|uniref:carbohydrate-binding family 9-like protein n=1 Tax=Parapedobacter sp. GCM10030251 TaxID=3273419 RepID=UPI0036125AD0